MIKQYKSEALTAAHEGALRLAEAGLMSKRTMRAFDETCLTPVEEWRRRTSVRCGSARMRVKRRCSRATSTCRPGW